MYFECTAFKLLALYFARVATPGKHCQKEESVQKAHTSSLDGRPSSRMSWR